MAKAQKGWYFSPPKPTAPKVSAKVKAYLQQKADELVETVLKPKHVKSMPEDYQFNYIEDIYTKWYRHYFYFCAKFHVSGPHAMVPFFETKFARLEYVSENSFNLAYMRHTEQWFEVYTNLSLDKCLEIIQNESLFHP
jgi:hypothetical protein